MIHKFKDSIMIGDAGEEIFLRNFPSYQKNSQKDYTDFRCQETGQTLELKTDNYSMSRTPNFFIERYSSDTTMLPGGPYRNLNTSWWAYYYIWDGVLFVFEPNQLVTRIHELGLDEEHLLVPVKNKGYNTLGFKIPRSTVEDLATIVSMK